jgi:hypothetical protein
MGRSRPRTATPPPSSHILALSPKVVNLVCAHAVAIAFREGLWRDDDVT